MRFEKLYVVGVMLILGAVFAPHASAGWRLLKEDHRPDFKISVDHGMHARSWAYAFVSGMGSFGEGMATEPYSSFADTTSSVAVVGTLFRSYAFQPAPNENVGEVEYGGRSEIEGEANLIDADCTGVAIGFCELKFLLDGGEDRAYAELIESAASTRGGTGGSVNFGFHQPKWGGGFSFDIRGGVGEGLYSDEDRDIVPFRVKCPVNSFILQTKNRAYILVWANEFWGMNAEVTSRMGGALMWNYDLLSWPECP